MLLVNGFSRSPAPQRHLPPLVIGGPLPCLGVGAPLIGLQEQGHAEQVRRYARSPKLGVVELGEVLVPEQLVPMPGQKAIEGSVPDVLQVELVLIEDRGLGSR